MGSSKKHDVSYDDARQYVAGKDLVVNTFVQTMLAKTAQMFEYDGLPDSIPKRELELILQRDGQAFITMVDGKLYAFGGGIGGPLDEYYRPTIFTVANPWLNLSAEYRIGVDGIRVLSDSAAMGIMPILKKYAVLSCDSILSFDTIAVLSRFMLMIDAPDDASKASADSFVNKMMKGEFSVVGDSAFFDGVKMQAPGTNTATLLQQITEAVQFVKASCYNELGIGASYNMKRERLNLAEVEQTNAGLIPLVYDMLQCRRLYLDQVNDMFGTEISVKFSSVWMNDDDISDGGTDGGNDGGAGSEGGSDEGEGATDED